MEQVTAFSFFSLLLPVASFSLCIFLAIIFDHCFTLDIGLMIVGWVNYLRYIAVHAPLKDILEMEGPFSVFIRWPWLRAIVLGSNDSCRFPGRS